MYLKQIIANGFKSFADKTNIEFNKSIAGIVGPNGSGKSNIVDAVRWVLGEQSIKSLRGTNMSDVIFSGSKTRNASTCATVTLIFDNTDNMLPIEYSEVAIKRTIYKTGESEYYLNNEKCRLKDITDLFIDAGVSKESFNIISQGDIATILSDKAEDRRIIFDAASGVLKYKKRKEEAIRKLEKTNNNLIRVNDIINEIETNLDPLYEQSKVAKKYLECKELLDDLEVALIVTDIEKLNDSVNDCNEKIISLKDQIFDMETNSNIGSTNLEELKLKYNKINDEVYNKQQELLSLVTEVEKLSGDKNLIIERQKYKSDDIKVHSNIINLKEKILKIDNELSISQDKIKAYLNDINENNSILTNLKNTYNSINQNKSASEKELFNLNNRYSDINYKIDRIRNSIENNTSLPFAVRSVLENPRLSGIHSVIGKLIEVDEKYELAINTALGFSSSFVVVDNEEAAKKAISFLKTNNAGKATFFPLNIIEKKAIDNSTYQNLNLYDGYIGIASSLVKYESTYDNIIQNQLGTTIVVDNIDNAVKLAATINYRYRIVTLNGEVIHVGGSLTGGSEASKTSIILEKRELENLNKEKIKVEEQIENIKQEISKFDIELNLEKEKQEKSNYIITNLETKIEYEKNDLLDKQKQKEEVTKEIESMDKLANNILSEHENKVLEEYYSKIKEKEQKELEIKVLIRDLTLEKEKIDEIEKEYKFNNEEYNKQQDKLKQLEIKNSRSEVKLDTLLNILTEEYSLTYERAKEHHILEIDYDDAKKKVKEARETVKELGTVNIGAVEEYNRINTRYEFLNTQRTDLIKANDTINDIITELDEIMKDKFEESFKIIQIKFKEVFKKLFYGGTAELKLTDPKNILTTGIDIIALPPGKKLQNISLLSGGEKALTAIALLFSILETKVVPFCILDEVEAALDEVNVDTFGEYLESLKNRTQFIVITHKKKTMEFADILYGITMEESGVSKLVSVKLEDIK